MHPIIRISLVVAALAGIWLVGRTMWPLVASNLVARKTWNLTEGEVRGMNGTIEFELGHEPDAYRAFAEVNHTWGLSLFKKVPLFVDPADPARVKPAGFLQMWLAPAEMAGLIVLLLAVTLMAALPGSQSGAGQSQGQWAFSASPGALEDGISLHSPTRQWKIVLGWSILGVAMAVSVIFSKGNNQAARLAYLLLGCAFTAGLWIFAWHTKSLEISANPRGVRMTSVLGWRDVPWEMIRSVEEQEIFTTYYNGNMRMWELPFPGSTVRVFALNDERGRTVMSFSPDLEPKAGLKQLFELCTQRTGSALKQRKIPLPF
jgi:hypothetical protein